MNTIKPMNRFLSNIYMAKEIFHIFQEKAMDIQLKNLFLDICNTFESHEKKITEIICKLGLEPSENMMLSQVMATKMERFKARVFKTDFKLCMLAIKDINMGIIGGLEFLHKYQQLEFAFLDKGADVVKDYDNILSKVKKFVSEHYIKNK